MILATNGYITKSRYQSIKCDSCDAIRCIELNYSNVKHVMILLELYDNPSKELVMEIRSLAIKLSSSIIIHCKHPNNIKDVVDYVIQTDRDNL